MAPRTLTIASAQPETVAGDLDHNVRAHAEVIRSSGARLVVFPELSLTGYELDGPVLEFTDPALQPIVDACRDHNAVALVGAAVLEQAGRFIAVLRIDADGVRVASRKTWLHGDESLHFSAGDGPYVTDIDGWMVGVAICKDTYVAEHTARFASMGVDLYVAGVLDTPGEHEQRTARSGETARALGVPVAIANYRGATSLYPVTAGSSAIYDADGLELSAAGSDRSFALATITAERARPNTKAPTTTSAPRPITTNDRPA